MSPLFKDGEWRAHQSIHGIPFVNYISLALESHPKVFVLVYFLLFNRIPLIALNDNPKHIAVVHPT